MSQAVSYAEKFRQAVKENSARKEEVVDVKLPNGEIWKVLLIEPTVKGSAFVQKAAKLDKTGEIKIDTGEFNARTLILLCHCPETRQPLFTELEIEDLKGWPSNLLEAFIKEINKSSVNKADDGVESKKD